MDAIELIADKDSFSRLSAQCETIMDTGKRLPEFVFRRPFAKYFAVEYSHIYRRRFGEFLADVSKVNGDDSVNYLVLNPSSGDDYYRHSSFFGLVSFLPSSLPERYGEVMGQPKSCSTILAGADWGVFWGSSLRWGVYADRLSWELAVIAVQEDVNVSALLGWPCFSAEQVASYVTSQYHTKDPSDSIAAEFCRKFLANYRV